MSRVLSGLAAATISLALLPAGPAAAMSQTYTVTTTADTADGTCDADCSLREAITAANANPGFDTVVLPAGTYLLAVASTDEDGNLDGDLDVTDDVRILGVDAATTVIDADGDGDGEDDGDHGVIEVAEGRALGLADVTVTGGDSGGDGDQSNGGGIYLNDSGTLSLQRVTVSGNTASTGGGVYGDDGPIMRVEDTVFEDNTASSSAGGLFIDEGLIELRNVTFTDNTASSDGGGMEMEHEVTARAWNLTMTGNEAGTDGGGLIIADSSYGTLMQCWACTFTENRAGSEGGGIMMESNEALLEAWDLVVEDNVAESDGGGLFMDESSLFVERGSFARNVAYDHGGGISGEEISVILKDVDIVDNRADDPTTTTDRTNGGGFSNEDDYGEVILDDVRIERNFATEEGGGIYLYETSLIVRDSVIRDNVVDGSGHTSDVTAGAIGDDNESRVLVERTLIEGNSITGTTDAYGGAIWTEEGAYRIIDSIIRNNTATSTSTDPLSHEAAGGAILVEDESTPYDIDGTLFEGNRAVAANVPAVGGAIAVFDGGNLHVTNSTMSGNEASSGGAVHVREDGVARLQSVTVVGNTADDGAAFQLDPDDGSGAGRLTATGLLVQDHADDSCAGAAITSNGWNIVDDTTCGLDEPSDQDDTDAAYEALADNGGFAPTHALPATSIAIDAGATTCRDAAGIFALTTDQRGAGRAVDGDADGDAACDVGAFEFQEAVTVVASDDAAIEGDVDAGTLAFTFSRPGTDGALDVSYTVTGSADGDDYDDVLTGTVTIPDGAASVDVVVTPTDDGLDEGDETIVVTLTANPSSYSVGAPSTATATISDPTGRPVGVERLAGDSRTETAIAVANDSYSNGSAGAVVLTRSDIFPDALAGTPFAVAEDAPILLTPPDALDADVLVEIQRVLPAGGTVHLLGGTVALSEAVESAVSDAGFVTNRIAGQDRIETSILIADELGDPDTLLLTTGFDFPDALAAGPAAAAVGGAVILTSSETPAPRTLDYLSTRGGATVYAIGGPAARAHPTAEGIIGENRAQTAVLTAQEFFTDPSVVGLAISTNFPDALAGGVHIGRLGGPLLITNGSSLDDDPEGYLCDESDSLDALFIYGGTAVLDNDVLNDAGGRIDGTGC